MAGKQVPLIRSRVAQNALPLGIENVPRFFQRGFHVAIRGKESLCLINC